MRPISIIFRRELAAYLRSPVGYIIAAVVLLFDGLLFQVFALRGEQLSADVLTKFFYWTAAPTGIAGLALSFRLIAEERQHGTFVLLATSPIRDVEIVLGKFFAAFVFLSGITLLTGYMPLLILVHGKISFSQVAVGYLGLLLLGGATLSVGIFASALTRSQILALVFALLLGAELHLLFWVSEVVDPPLKDVVAELALFVRRFDGFMHGILNLKDVVFYVALTYFFLLLAVKTMEAKRWQ